MQMNAPYNSELVQLMTAKKTLFFFIPLIILGVGKTFLDSFSLSALPTAKAKTRHEENKDDQVSYMKNGKRAHWVAILGRNSPTFLL